MAPWIILCRRYSTTQPWPSAIRPQPSTASAGCPVIRFEKGSKRQDRNRVRREEKMTTAIGVVMTEHIVAGRMENHRLVGEPVRYPSDATEVDALTVLPGGELLEILANHVTDLVGNGGPPVEAVGVAVPGVVRHGIVEDAPNLTQIKG